jgi:hypothetical protein
VSEYSQLSRRWWCIEQPDDEHMRAYERCYLVHCDETRRVKIGYSRKPWSRARAVASTSPTATRVLGVIDAGPSNSHGRWLERFLHDEYRDAKYRYEWFEARWSDVLRSALYALRDLESGVDE